MRVILKTNKISPHLNRINKRLSKVPSEAHGFFVKTTPIRTGNARRRTRLQGQTIKADYPYAARLDDGYSRQAPEGMSDPTIDYIKDRVADILGA